MALLPRLCGCSPCWVQKAAGKKQSDFFWNDVISIVAEAYQVLSVCAFIHLAGKPGHSGSPAEKFADVCNFALLLLVLAFPGTVFLIYWNRLRHAKPDLSTIRRIRRAATSIQNTNPDQLKELDRPAWQYMQFYSRFGVLVEDI